MDSNKLEISGKQTVDEPPPLNSYRQIPDDDMDVPEVAITRPKSLLKSPTNSPEVDGADEKMLPQDEAKISPNSNLNAGDVKFTSNEKQNGDTKLDIGDLKSSFVGMGKEELMKYANDPFWIRLRWVLFVGFWLLWAGMLVGAILIIVAAPKCAPPEPRTWWQEGPLTEVDTKITPNELKSIKDAGVQGVLVDWPLDTYKAPNASPEFTNFLQLAKDTDINVIVGLEPGMSNVWFEKSTRKDDTYVDYYVWKDPLGTNSSGIPLPPTNWMSPLDVSSWVYSDARKQFYLAPFSAPQLNFREQKVIDEFTKVLGDFLAAGVKGVRLKGAPYLLVDESFADETFGSNPSYTLGQYGFYKHSKTSNSKELGPLLKTWRDFVKNKTENGPFMLSDDLMTLEPYKVNGTTIVDLPRHSGALNKSIVSGLQLKIDIDSAYSLMEKNWLLWENQNSGLNSDVMDIVTFMLPGSVLVPRNHTVDKELLTFRKSPSIMYGNFTTYEVANSTFAFIRITAGNPGYLVALNPTNERVVVDFPTEIKLDSEEFTVQLFSKNYNETFVDVKVKIMGHAVPISPRSSIILTYVPKP